MKNCKTHINYKTPHFGLVWSASIFLMVRTGQKRWRHRVFAFLPNLFIVALCVLGVAYMENVLWKLKIRSLRCSGKSTTEGISDRVSWMQDLGRQNVERKIFLRNINLPGSEVFEQTAAKSWFLLLPGLPWLQRSWFLIGGALVAYGGGNLLPCLSTFCTVVHNNKSIVSRSFVHDRGPWGRALYYKRPTHNWVRTGQWARCWSATKYLQDIQCITFDDMQLKSLISEWISKLCSFI